MYLIEERNGAASRYFHGNGPVNTCTDDGGWMRFSSFDGLLPDLSDPATVGCLLALVREAWNNLDLHVQRDGRFFVVNPTPKGSPFYGDIDAPTEAAVLVAALEAAP
jgi:hypothetical protein